MNHNLLEIEVNKKFKWFYITQNDVKNLDLEDVLYELYYAVDDNEKLDDILGFKHDMSLLIRIVFSGTLDQVQKTLYDMENSPSV